MQKLSVTVIFNVDHSPDLESHRKQVLRSYLQSKGVQTVQEYDHEGKPKHHLVIEL